MKNFVKLKSEMIIKWQMGLTLVVLILLTMSQILGFIFGRIHLHSFPDRPGQVIGYAVSLLLRYMELVAFIFLKRAIQKKNLSLLRTWFWNRSGIYGVENLHYAVNEMLKDSELQYTRQLGSPWMSTNVIFGWIWWIYLTLDLLCLPIHLMELAVANGKEKGSWTLLQAIPFKRFIWIQCPFYLLPMFLYTFIYLFKIVNYFMDDEANRGDYYVLGLYTFKAVISPVVLPMFLLLYKGMQRGDVSKLLMFYKLHLVFVFFFAVAGGVRRILENLSQPATPNSSSSSALNLIIVYYFLNYLLLNIFLLEFVIQLRLPKTLPTTLFDSESSKEANKSCKSLVSQNSDFFQKITIPQKQIKVYEDDKLGEGQFSNVYKAQKFPARDYKNFYGWLKYAPQKQTSAELVAVKVLKHRSDQMYAEALLKELKILDGVGEHEHLLKCHGCCVWNKDTKNVRKKQSVIAIVLEYCSLGSLQTYLISLSESNIPTADVDISELLRFSFEISEGMTYLEEQKVVHADLAARNVLLDGNKRVKITDFGMSLQLYYYQVYASSMTDLFPWKSMAPESLQDLKFSSKSDVWSYGILLFEIFSLGDVPYPGLVWTSHVVQEIIAGLRPDKPKHGGNAIFEIMSHCWELNPKRRPGFKEISMCLARLRNKNP